MQPEHARDLVDRIVDQLEKFSAIGTLPTTIRQGRREDLAKALAERLPDYRAGASMCTLRVSDTRSGDQAAVAMTHETDVVVATVRAVLTAPLGFEVEVASMTAQEADEYMGEEFADEYVERIEFEPIQHD